MRSVKDLRFERQTVKDGAITFLAQVTFEDGTAETYIGEEALNALRAVCGDELRQGDAGADASELDGIHEALSALRGDVDGIKAELAAAKGQPD